MSSTISGVDSGQSWSPLTRMQYQLQSAVNNGTVKTEDQDALSAALTDINTQLQSSTTLTSSSTPGGMKSTIDGLISDEVSSGKLTDDQAGELKSVFAQAAQKMHGHHCGMGGAGDGDGDGDDSNSTDPITGTSASAATSFVDFLQKLETALADSINGVAGTSASTDSTATTSTTSDSTASATSTTSTTDPRQLMLAFLQKLESALSSTNTYSSAGTSSGTDTQAVLVNAYA